jgi:hypothetical protein
MEVPQAFESGCANKLTGSAAVTSVAAARTSAVLRWGSLEGFQAEVTRRKEKAQDSYEARCEAAAAAASAAASAAAGSSSSAAASASAAGGSSSGAAAAAAGGSGSGSGSGEKKKRKPKKPTKPKALRLVVNVLGDRQAGFWRKSLNFSSTYFFCRILRRFMPIVSVCQCCIQYVRHVMMSESLVVAVVSASVKVAFGCTPAAAAH